MLVDVKKASYILSEGGRLLRYACEHLAGSQVWSRFEERCLNESYTRVEALYEALVAYPFTFSEYMEKCIRLDQIYDLNDYIEDCIEEWLYFREQRDEGIWEPKRRALIYYTREKDVKLLYIEKIVPRCQQCSEELIKEPDGSYYCLTCEIDC